MYRNRVSDFSVSACDVVDGSQLFWSFLLIRSIVANRMNLLHLAKSHLVQPVRFWQITAFVFLHKLQKNEM